MNYTPIINSKMSAFSKNYALEKLDNNELFEMFINNLILRSYQPEAFSVMNDLFDQICVGGTDDTGIDGLAIKVNGIFVSTKEDVDNIIKKNTRITIDFLFVQSKHKNHLDSGEFSKFLDGVTDYLSEKQYEPCNERISAWLDLKNYLFSEEVLVHWQNSPNVKLFYVYMGTWQENEHMLAKFERTKNTLNGFGLFESISLKILDSTKIKKMIDEVDNQFNKAITIIDSLELNEAPNVTSSRVLLCSAEDFLQLLLDEDDELRRTLFKDNIRDYQGATDINEDIFRTIETTPENFCLLNNGITIVCKSMLLANRKVNIENPQIVNGCQTCNTIYKAYKCHLDLSKISLIVKLISTDNNNVTNAIVKGTNRQNVVYNEAFEITRQFHKDLEEFVELSQTDIPANEKVYYERRSNQFATSLSIMTNQIASFKLLIQGFVSIILQMPHEGFIHDSYLLDKYTNSIFIEGQSFALYYLAMFLNVKAEQVFKRNYQKYKSVTTYKHQILCLLVETIAGVVPDINNTKRINQYCEKVFAVIKNQETLEQHIDNSIRLLQEVIKNWVHDKGSKYRNAIKDNADFTKYMLTYIRGGNTDKILQEITDAGLRGTVVTIKKDRNNLYYGYIKSTPADVFIHEDDNPSIRFYNLKGKDVVYSIFARTKYSTPRGKIKYVVPEQH